MKTYEVRESSSERPEESKALRTANADGSPLTFAQAMKIAEAYNANGRAVYVSIVNQ